MAAGDIIDYFEQGGVSVPVRDMQHLTDPPSPQDFVSWTIFKDPRDYPGKYVARRSDLKMGAQQEIHVTGWIVVADTLEQCRAGLPPGLTCVQVDNAKDPRQIEAWI